MAWPVRFPPAGRPGEPREQEPCVRVYMPRPVELGPPAGPDRSTWEFDRLFVAAGAGELPGAAAVTAVVTAAALLERARESHGLSSGRRVWVQSPAGVVEFSRRGDSVLGRLRAGVQKMGAWTICAR